HGDLRENAEYHAAKEHQSHLAGRIAYLEGRVSLAEVIDPSKITMDRVAFGATVTLENLDTEEKVTYQIVGEDESDPSNFKISIKSPLARAMMGKAVDDDFVLKTSAGEKEYAVITIQYK
ncbi:transcription elongation factor GreA, partial [Myxococcota bacterium]|nr:transcription elongation factor GreA [Myxococcota bacterium]